MIKDDYVVKYDLYSVTFQKGDYDRVDCYENLTLFYDDSIMVGFKVDDCNDLFLAFLYDYCIEGKILFGVLLLIMFPDQAGYENLLIKEAAKLAEGVMVDLEEIHMH